MKLYTKTGDKGTTSLVGGTRVPKNHPRVEAYGDVDELISYLGVIISDCQIANVRAVIKMIQENLMLVSAHLASDNNKKKLSNIKEDDITFLESEIDFMTTNIPEQKAFILPDAPRISSECHVARTICRRSERHATAIETEDEQVKLCLKYLNRLSDYLFVLARFLCYQSGYEERFWQP
jgi:ATP:cob(I)alamin adenosyltransferase